MAAWTIPLMRIRMQLSTFFWIRIWLPKIMQTRIHPPAWEEESRSGINHFGSITLDSIVRCPRSSPSPLLTTHYYSAFQRLFCGSPSCASFLFFVHFIIGYFCCRRRRWSTSCPRLTTDHTKCYAKIRANIRYSTPFSLTPN